MLNYSNSRLKPKQLSAKREKQIRKDNYHFNYAGGKQKLVLEKDRDELLQHIDWQREQMGKQLATLLETDCPTAEQLATEARREGMTQNQIITEIANALGITLQL